MKRGAVVGLASLLMVVVVGVGLVHAGSPSLPSSDPTSQGSGPASPTSTGPGAAPVERPNIVLITTDDQSLAEMRWMPKTRALLGGQGVTLRNFVAPQPLCCPSRAQLLTGQYAQNNGVLDNSGRRGGVEAFEAVKDKALPVWMQRAGYRTGFAGKYLNQYTADYGVPPGWEEWDATVGGLFDYTGFTQYDGTGLTKPAGHQSDYLAQSSADFIEEATTDDRPFFLWASYSAPHGTCIGDTEGGCAVPPIPAERHRDLYANVPAPFAGSPEVRERDVSDKPAYVRAGVRPKPAAMQRLFTQRIRSLASVDDAVATTVAALRQAGELDDTVVVFTSDNGYMFGEHGYTGKIVAYDESVRVPLLLRGPGVPAGVVRGQPGSMTDLAPTFAAIGGAQPLVPVDGRTLVPTIFDYGDQGDRTLLVQAGWRGPGSRGRAWLFRGVRTMRYTYVDWRADRDELYDRRRDPHELVNLIDRPAYAAVRAELLRRTRVLGVCSGDACRRTFPDVPLPRLAPRARG